MENNIVDRAAAATAEDGSRADRTCGAEEGCCTRESAASETAREESPIRDNALVNKNWTLDFSNPVQ